MTVRFEVESEIAPLTAVVTSPPGPEFDLMEPANLEQHRLAIDGTWTLNPDYLLFDDLVLLRTLQREHRQLDAVLTAAVGEHHISFRELLVGALADEAVRGDVIDRALATDAELYGRSQSDLTESRAALVDLDAPDLTEALLVGRAPYGSRRLFRWPLPNTLFARDLAAIVGETVVLTHAARPARRRDFLLSRTVFRHHPWFRDVDRIDIADDGPIRGPQGPIATVEGGDVLVIRDDLVLIGVGERTTMEAARRVARRLFDRAVDTVLICEAPPRRSAMHVDTLFTLIDDDHCLLYPPMVLDPERLGIRMHRLTSAGAEGDAGPDLLAALRAEGVPLTPIFCGGDDPILQTREQWSDGANAFALAPGLIVCYRRNERTLRELNRAGYRVVAPDDFVSNAAWYRHHSDRIVVALDGYELVRGRGGPRCLTLPLGRASPVLDQA